MPATEATEKRAAHTPGPWRLTTNGAIVLGPENDEIVGRSPQVAHICARRARSDGTTSVEVEQANAHLIAAAPCLLEKAQAVLDAWDNPPSTDTGTEFAQLRAAITEATDSPSAPAT